MDAAERAWQGLAPAMREERPLPAEQVVGREYGHAGQDRSRSHGAACCGMDGYRMYP
jgi:hypothetical protein